MERGYRRRRLEKEIFRRIATRVHFGLKDPALLSAEVTRVQLTEDGSLARVYVTAPGSREEKMRLIGRLNRLGPRLRSEISGALRLRRVPEVRFVEDRGMENAKRVEEILDRLRSERRGGAEEE